jgi:hypothetical protein
MRKLSVIAFAVTIAACSSGSHKSLPSPTTAPTIPTTTTTTPRSLCHGTQIAVGATKFVPPIEGTLQLAAGLTKPRPIDGVVTATNDARARCTVTVPSDGRFTMNLDAGTYRFTATSPKFNRGTSLCRARYPVTLEPRSNRSQGPLVVVAVTCDGS